MKIKFINLDGKDITPEDSKNWSDWDKHFKILANFHTINGVTYEMTSIWHDHKNNETTIKLAQGYPKYLDQRN